MGHHFPGILLSPVQIGNQRSGLDWLFPRLPYMDDDNQTDPNMRPQLYLPEIALRRDHKIPEKLQTYLTFLTNRDHTKLYLYRTNNMFCQRNCQTLITV